MTDIIIEDKQGINIAKNIDLSWFQCPSCGSLGKIDVEQKTGKVSIICAGCGWHGYHSSAPSGNEDE